MKDMQFSIDLRELGSEKNPARIAFGEIVKEGKEVFLIGNAKDPEDAITTADSLERKLRDAGIKDIISINTFIPPHII